ncbi:hypothetical protein BJ912DRAFT_931665 [Pholiota molesta]|nr:hypothetical protein BJ912DRAFT_931665 [Pholiota molesta]
MAFCKLLLVACISGVVAIPAPDTFTPITPQGNVAAATNPSQDGDRRLYYQDATGVILEYSFSGFFGSGHTIAPPIVLVPAAEVLPGTPISVVWKSNNGGEPRCQRVLLCVRGVERWRSCSACLTQYGFTSAAGTVELYSAVNTAGNIAVGHVAEKLYIWAAHFWDLKLKRLSNRWTCPDMPPRSGVLS